MSIPRSVLAPPIFLLGLGIFAAPTTATAGEPPKAAADAKADGTAAPAAGAEATPADGTKAEATAETKPVPEVKADKSDPNDPTETPGKTYYFVGARYRHTVIPTWMINLFAAGGPTGGVSVPSAGIEGGMRKDGFDTILSLSYADYSMKQFPFKGKDEADEAYELVTSSLKLINLAVDMLWSAEINKQFAFNYGATAGIGIVFGDLNRVQAQPPSGPNGAPSDPYGYQPCAGAGTGKYCDKSNSHYGDYAEPSWFNGGKKPNVYPIFGPQLGLRFKPVKQFVARADVGFNIFSGFFFGIGLQYGI